MLDERDLQAIARIMDEKISASEARTAAMMDTKLDQQKAEIMHEVGALMDEKISASEARTAAMMDTKLDQQKSELQAEIRTSESHMMAMMEAYFEPRFNLLADGQKLIREQMVKKEDLEEKFEDIQTQLDVLKAVVKRNSLEIEKLKKAQ